MKLVVLLAVCAWMTACASTSVQNSTAPPAGVAAPQDAQPQNPPPQKAQPSANSMRLSIGGRGLDESQWMPVENQGAFGFEFVREPVDSLIGFELGTQFGIAGERVHFSSGDATLVSTVSEIYGGLHKTFVRGATVEPYIGGGVTLVYATFSTDFGSTTTSDQDTSAGFYLHGGIQTHVASNLIIGLDVRTVFDTDINLFGTSGDADYGQLAFFLGVGF